MRMLVLIVGIIVTVWFLVTTRNQIDEAKQKGDHQEAIEQYGKLISFKEWLSKRPSYELPPLYFNRALEYIESGDYKAAIDDLNEIIENVDKKDTYYKRSLSRRAVAYAKLGDLNKAFADFNAAIAIDPNYAETYNLRAIVYIDLGDLDKAIDDFEQMIRLDPIASHNFATYRTWADVYIRRAFNRYKAGEFDKAASDLDKAAALDPTAAIYKDQGNFYGAAKDYKSAIVSFSKAIALDPNNARLYRSRGACYAHLKMYAQAETDAKKACELGDCELSQRLQKMVSQK